MRHSGTLAVVSVFAALCCGPAAWAQDGGEQATPPILQDLFDCRAIEDTTHRLACYDGRTDALVQARDTGQLMIADREQIREARRGLFGLALPRLRIFGRDDETGNHEEQVRNLEGVIRSVSETYNGYIFVLEEGGTWMQSERQYPGIEPKPGHKIHIRRAALGSFMASIEGRNGFRIKRLR
ncbi:hypothetical protein J4558_02655 [Leptolyngbya sp. 15MV]|nr:hypothetical protein J4558_02655 [Leptolyngbya sp. 15MV]